VIVRGCSLDGLDQPVTFGAQFVDGRVVGAQGSPEPLDGLLFALIVGPLCWLLEDRGGRAASRCLISSRSVLILASCTWMRQ
jgi:hypothetical protein